MTAPLDPFARRARRLAMPHDADTLALETDSGYGGRMEPPAGLRLDGVYMPELRKPGGPEMRQVLIDWCDAAPRVTWPFWVKSTMTKTRTREAGQRVTLARYLSTVWHFDGQYTVGPSLNAVLIAALSVRPEWGRGIGGRP